MTTTPPKRRRWLQFRLRALLIAVLVLSVPLQWFFGLICTIVDVT